MATTGGPRALSLERSLGSRLNHEPSATTKITTTTIEATIGHHNQMQALGNSLSRHQRHLASPLALASGRTINPASNSQHSDESDHQQVSAIAARLSRPTSIASGLTVGDDENERPSRHQLSYYVNLELVRDLIVRHSIELAIVLVILIYLVYYFSRISRRPKLIGNKQSDFVASIGKSFERTLQSRFSPLIYFWGTNPQTALFGYLQGQTSNDEMPRSKFHRQYLYVSDVQYLASNIDLSEHYAKCTRRTHFNHQLGHKQQILEEEHGQQDSGGQQQLSQNIRFVLSERLETVAATAKPARCPLAAGGRIYHSEGEEEELAMTRTAAHEGGGSDSSAQRSAGKLNRMLTRTTSADCSEASAIGSSSDSGVFANCESSNSSASSSSSSSSGSSLTIDMVSTPGSDQSKSSSSSSSTSSSRSSSSTMSSSSDASSDGAQQKCSCNSPYENKLDELAMIRDQQPRQPDVQHHNLCHQDHLSQLVAGAKGATMRRQFKREHFEYGQCALDWHLDSHEQYHKNKSVALISAGMTTGSDKKYVTDTVQTLHKLGYEVCVFIRRGVGGLKLNSSKFFSPSKWHDFEAAILSIKKQRPDCRLVAVGFSFGSIELCRYLSMSGERSLVASALLISCPFDPYAGGQNMRKRALNRKIDAYLAKNLGKQLYQALSFKDSTSGSGSNNEQTAMEAMEEGDSGLSSDSSKSTCMGKGRGKQQRAGSEVAAQHQDVSQKFVHENYNGSMIDLSCLPKVRSLVDFEMNYNRVIQNYPSGDAYGADSRLNEQLAQIKTPTLCLSSEDDFMAPFKLLPIKQIEANENLCMILTKRGGHMAFIDGLLWPTKPYFAQRIIEEYMKLSPKVNDKTSGGSSSSRSTK